ncbi:hypothetical protein TELCIR_20079, partial [Teladorsagia circumcincta]
LSAFISLCAFRVQETITANVEINSDVGNPPLYVQVNNAGGTNSAGWQKPELQCDLSNFEYTLNLNTKSVLRLCQLAFPHLTESKGEIINVSSVAGLPNGATLASPYYSIAKAAQDQLTRNLAIYFIQKGVRVNGITISARIRSIFALVALKRAVGLVSSANGILDRDEPPQFVQEVFAVVLPLPQYLEEVVIPEFAFEAVPFADLALQDGPQAFNTLSVGSCRRIHEVDAVVHRLVDVTEIGEVVVTTPHVGSNRSSRNDVPLDYTFQSSGVAFVDDFDEDHLRSVLDSSDEPISANDTANVVLPAHDVGFVDLYDRVRAAKLYDVVPVELDEHISEPLAPLQDRVLLHFERSSHFRRRAQIVSEQVARQKDLLSITMQGLEECVLQVTDLPVDSRLPARAKGALELPSPIFTIGALLLGDLPRIPAVWAWAILPEQSSFSKPGVELLRRHRGQLRPG